MWKTRLGGALAIPTCFDLVDLTRKFCVFLFFSVCVVFLRSPSSSAVSTASNRVTRSGNPARKSSSSIPFARLMSSVIRRSWVRHLMSVQLPHLTSSIVSRPVKSSSIRSSRSVLVFVDGLSVRHRKGSSRRPDESPQTMQATRKQTKPTKKKQNTKKHTKGYLDTVETLWYPLSSLC